jgi:hypothetical protein
MSPARAPVWPAIWRCDGETARPCRRVRRTSTAFAGATRPRAAVKPALATASGDARNTQPACPVVRRAARARADSSRPACATGQEPASTARASAAIPRPAKRVPVAPPARATPSASHRTAAPMAAAGKRGSDRAVPPATNALRRSVWMGCVVKTSAPAGVGSARAPSRRAAARPSPPERWIPAPRAANETPPEPASTRGRPPVAAMAAAMVWAGVKATPMVPSAGSPPATARATPRAPLAPVAAARAPGRARAAALPSWVARGISVGTAARPTPSVLPAVFVWRAIAASGSTDRSAARATSARAASAPRAAAAGPPATSSAGRAPCRARRGPAPASPRAVAIRPASVETTPVPTDATGRGAAGGKPRAPPVERPPARATARPPAPAAPRGSA